MDKKLLLGLLLVLIVFIIISYYSKGEIFENRVNDNIDKQEYFHGNSGGYKAQHCCPNGMFGNNPNCNYCPTGTTSAASVQGGGDACQNLLQSSCKRCPVCFEVKAFTCQPKSCPKGGSCVTVPNQKKRQVAGNCYY
jgi:hypothetical protein